jgi:hypothetical protein
MSLRKREVEVRQKVCFEMMLFALFSLQRKESIKDKSDKTRLSFILIIISISFRSSIMDNSSLRFYGFVYVAVVAFRPGHRLFSCIRSYETHGHNLKREDPNSIARSYRSSADFLIFTRPPSQGSRLESLNQSSS